MPDMTCHELRSYLENRNDASSAAKHLQNCTECRRLVDAEEELRRCLRSVRGGVPEVPAALDSAVLTAYREYLQQPPVPSLADSFRSRMNAFSTRFTWAAVAVALLAVILFVAERKVAPRSESSSEPTFELRATQPNATAVPRTTQSGNVQLGTLVAKSPAHRRNVTTSRPQFSGSKGPPAPVVANSSFAAGFQNLMYCDLLSCAGALEVIRMELPAASVNRDLTAQQRNGIVLADVLVGSDGIARAIRIVN
jgi:hypothetical protein